MYDHLELELMDSCEPPRGCWDPNLGLPQEQQVPLISPAQPYKKLYISFVSSVTKYFIFRSINVLTSNSSYFIFDM